MGLSKEEYLNAHQRFFELKRRPGRRFFEILDYDLYVDRVSRYHGVWMRVSSECATGVNELLNWINHFASLTSDLEIWSEVLEEQVDPKSRFSIYFEIVSPIAFTTLSFPAAIRGKLIFTISRALRDLFEIKKPNGRNFEDQHLNLEALRQILEKISNPVIKSSLKKFLQRIIKIDGDDFRSVTLNYRNRANHQIAPYVEFGERLAFAPIKQNGFEGFSFGVEKAVKLVDLAEPLREQHKACLSAVEPFWEVVAELNNIMRVEGTSL